MKKVIIKMSNLFIEIINFFIKKSNRIVLCGGWFGKRFADNSKAMYLYLFQNKDDLNLKKVIFVSKDKKIISDMKQQGYYVLYTNSFLSFWYHLRATYHIVDQGGNDVCRFLSPKAKRINLWHGFPLKKIGYLATNPDKALNEIISSKKTQFGRWENFNNLVLSDKHSEIQQYAFGLEEKKMIKGLYPRIAYMLGYIKPFYLEEEEKCYKTILKQREHGKKIIAYFPTFRDNHDSNKKCIDCVNELNKLFDNTEYLLITKMHFASDEKTVNPDLKNVINLPPESDINNFMTQSDLLITDYSSVYFDYVLLNKPLIFYNFDIDYYVNNDRGFLFSYNDFTPGEKVSDIEQLFNQIKISLADTQNYLNQYKDIYTTINKVVYDNININNNSMVELWNKIK